MLDTHAAAVALARLTVDQLETLFSELGISSPSGWLLRAYRIARRSIAGVLDNPYDAADVLAGLRDTAALHALELFNGAADLGISQASEELALYGIEAAAPELATLVSAAVQAFLATLDQQAASINALVSAGIADPALVLGDATRMGLFSPAPVLKEGARWVTQVTTSAWNDTATSSLEAAGAQDKFVRQAVAAIDKRTTDCCLQVHGQTVGITEDFILRGEPRYADHLRAPPFHWYCRTATTLVLNEHAGDSTSDRMRAAADAELKARASGDKSAGPNVVNAFSRRG